MSEAVDNTAVSRRKYPPIKLVKETSVKPTPLEVLVSEQTKINSLVNRRIHLAREEMSSCPQASEIVRHLKVLEDESGYWTRKLERMMEAKS